MLNQATLAGRIGRIRWIDGEVGWIRIAQNFPEREAEWFGVFIPPVLFPAAVASLYVGAEVVFTGRLRSRKETFGRANIDVVTLVAGAFVVGQPGRGPLSDDDPRDQFVTSRRRRRVSDKTTNSEE